MSSEKLTVLSINHAHIMAQNASDKKDYARMREIWLKVRDNLDIIGDCNDYHNYSVVMSGADDYLTAYEIVVRGMTQFPYNTDLLADAIYYGSNCNKYVECQKYVEILSNRPFSSWTWRAFQFLIDYFLDARNWQKDENTIIDGLNTALTIAGRYQVYCPSDERSYLAEYDIRQELAKVSMDQEDYEESEKQMQDALTVLKNAIQNGKYAAVQCSLRYADEMFRQQQYQEVIKTCDKALQYGQSTATARLGYFMYLSAQSREVLLYKSKRDWWTNKAEINCIYSEYLAAISDTGSDYIRNIKRRVNILAARSGIEPPQALMNSFNGPEDISALIKKLDSLKNMDLEKI